MKSCISDGYIESTSLVCTFVNVSGLDSIKSRECSISQKCRLLVRCSCSEAHVLIVCSTSFRMHATILSVCDMTVSWDALTGLHLNGVLCILGMQYIYARVIIVSFSMCAGTMSDIFLKIYSAIQSCDSVNLW